MKHHRILGKCSSGLLILLLPLALSCSKGNGTTPPVNNDFTLQEARIDATVLPSVKAGASRMSDDALLGTLQQKLIYYHLDYRHPTTGMARESTMQLHVSTTGGTGFGLMAMLAGADRGLPCTLFMSCPEIKAGMRRMGFKSPRL